MGLIHEERGFGSRFGVTDYLAKGIERKGGVEGLGQLLHFHAEISYQARPYFASGGMIGI